VMLSRWTFVLFASSAAAVENPDPNALRAACLHGAQIDEYMVTLKQPEGPAGRRLEDVQIQVSTWASKYTSSGAGRNKETFELRHSLVRGGPPTAAVSAGPETLEQIAADTEVEGIVADCLETLDFAGLPKPNPDDGLMRMPATEGLDCSECGYCIRPIESSECPSNAGYLQNCNDVGDGELCKGDGKCATSDSLDNCNPGGHDIYQKQSIQNFSAIYTSRDVTDDPAGLSWGLDRIDHHTSGLTLDGQYNDGDLTGEGVRVYIVDTGVEGSHEEFDDRVVSGFTAHRKDCDACRPVKGSLPADGIGCNDHGTHVASTVAGRNHGVAKKAIIVPVNSCFKIRCRDGRFVCASTSDISKGLEWVLEDAEAHPNEQAIVQRSLSGGFMRYDKELLKAGIHVIAAAGNANENPCISYYNAQTTAAKILVGATTINDGKASFSNFGACVHMHAPGHNIRAAITGGRYGTKSGTSMAAPHVSGAAAQILQIKPTLTPMEVKDALISKAFLGVLRGLDVATPNRLLAAGQAIVLPDAMLQGNTYAACQGTYARSTDTIGGRDVWDRVSPDASRFVYWCKRYNMWAIIGSGYRDRVISDDGSSCLAFIRSSTGATEWYDAKWDSAAAGKIAHLHGETYAACQGTYMQSHDMINGRQVWDRVSPDTSRFLFWCARSNKWVITGSQWRAQMLAQDGGSCGGFISSNDNAVQWYDADWSGAAATAATF